MILALDPEADPPQACFGEGCRHALQNEGRYISPSRYLDIEMPSASTGARPRNFAVATEDLLKKVFDVVPVEGLQGGVVADDLDEHGAS